VEVYARIRRAVQVDGMSIRQAAREFGLSRKTIRKMLQFSLPPGYARKKPVQRPNWGPGWASSIRSWRTISRNPGSSATRPNGSGTG
jgi:hypothetical protein